MRRGLEQHQEQDPSLLIRDTRTLGQKTRDFLKEPLYSASMFVVLAVCCILVPSIADVLVVFGVLLSFYCIAVARKAKLPFRMPMRSKATDYNDLSPGSNKPNTARGICFLGNEEKTNEELWFNNEDMRTHVLIFGSTGAGKTEALVSIAYNALLQGSGFIYVDGKGDNSLYAKVFAMCRRMGREDDLLLVNFMTGARDVIGAQESKLSNTMNPFATGSSSMLIALVVSLMGDSQGGSPDADMWKNRAINFVEALMKTLVYMRDEGKILLDANVIRQYFHLNMLEQIAIDKQFPREGQESVSLAEAPALVMEPIYNYLMNLPGFDFKKKGKQVSQTLEQHGFITMQLTRVFGSLADTYSHIIRTNIPEVDMHDVVLNRRILVVLLPALEKSPDELSNLGKIIVATLRAMMASGLGDSVEGSYKDVILTKPTNAKTPYMCILDEYGYYAVKGFAVVPAQARSLGFSTIFAGQDLPAFQKASKEEAASIGANTNIKICMKLEDPTETWEFFQKTAGESYVTKVDHFQTDQQSMMNNYMDTRSASAEKRGRVDLLDLKDQGMGEAHIFFKSGIIRAKMFYANPKPVSHMRLNHFLKVDKPTTKVLLDLEAQLESFDFLVKENPLLGMELEAIDEVEAIRRIFDERPGESAIEKSVAAFLACCDSGEAAPAESTTSLSGIAQTEASPSEPEVVDVSDRLNVFVKVKAVPLVEELVPQDRLNDFTANLLSKKNVRDKVELVERLMGKKSNQASNIAWEVVRDMESATDYPPPIRVNLSAAELTDITNKLIAYVKTNGKK